MLYYNLYVEILEKKMEDKTKRKKISKIKRRNAKLYPIYKMFAWDLLFFYSIEFLFLTMTKKIDPPTVLMVSGLYLIFNDYVIEV